MQKKFLGICCQYRIIVFISHRNQDLIMDKVKFTIEYPMKSVPVALLWTYLSTPSGLKYWFCDTVKQEGKHYTFGWSGSEQEAMLVAMRTYSYMRFHWIDENDKSYFELRIEVSELTDSTDLVITDYSLPEELEESRDVWNNQVEALQRQLGCVAD